MVFGALESAAEKQLHYYSTCRAARLCGDVARGDAGEDAGEVE